MGTQREFKKKNVWKTIGGTKNEMFKNIFLKQLEE